MEETEDGGDGRWRRRKMEEAEDGGEEGEQMAAAGPGQKNPESQSERIINKIGSRPDLVGADKNTQAVR